MPCTYFDAYPILLVTKSSLDYLATRRPESRWDSRRFRPNVLIDSPDAAPFPERSWVNRRVRIGTAVFQVMRTCPRCAMTTHPFADLPADPGIMRTLVRDADGDLGVYATVLETGRMGTRDIVELLD
jgi:uncharacterized protein YcbX